MGRITLWRPNQTVERGFEEKIFPLFYYEHYQKASALSFQQPDALEF